MKIDRTKWYRIEFKVSNVIANIQAVQCSSLMFCKIYVFKNGNVIFVWKKLQEVAVLLFQKLDIIITILRPSALVLYGVMKFSI